MQTGFNRLVVGDRGIVAQAGEWLRQLGKAVGLAHRIGVVIQTQGQRHFQLFAHTPLILSVEAQAVKRDGLTETRGKALLEKVNVAGEKSVYRSHGQAAGEHTVVKIGNVIATVIHTESHGVIAFIDGEVIHQLNLVDVASLGEEEVNTAQRSEVVAYEVQRGRESGEGGRAVCALEDRAVPQLGNLQLVDDVGTKIVGFANLPLIFRLIAEGVEGGIDRISEGGLHTAVGLNACKQAVLITEFVIDLERHLVLVGEVAGSVIKDERTIRTAAERGARLRCSVGAAGGGIVQVKYVGVESGRGRIARKIRQGCRF